MKNSLINIPNSIVYISHGGGPLPLLGDKNHINLVDTLQLIANKIKKPSAIIVISAHWKENIPTITCSAKPSLIYDYYGFPKESYEIKYSAQGNPILANKVFDLFCNSEIQAAMDESRGFDHGLFVPLKIMYPEADIPCIQISLLRNLDPIEHIKMGEALSGLPDSNILILGSGFSFHNLREFFTQPTSESKNMNEAFEEWLIDTCSNKNIDENERTHKLANWAKAPSARFCHPREDHLIPLHVCYGAAKRACREVFTFDVLGKKASAYLW